jgi:hypothetical protein
MTNSIRYEILDRWHVALFIEDGVLKSSPVGLNGVLTEDRYKEVIDLDKIRNDPYYDSDEGEGMEDFPDIAQAAYERLLEGTVE